MSYGKKADGLCRSRLAYFVAGLKSRKALASPTTDIHHRLGTWLPKCSGWTARLQFEILLRGDVFMVKPESKPAGRGNLSCISSPTTVSSIGSCQDSWPEKPFLLLRREGGEQRLEEAMFVLSLLKYLFFSEIPSKGVVLFGLLLLSDGKLACYLWQEGVLT